MSEPMNPAPPLPVAAGGPLALQLNDCWNRIGVGGDRSCRELDAHIHCRNCPVYSSAGAQLLERIAGPDYRRDWAEHYARQKVTAAPGKNSAVLFRLGPEWLALPTAAFQEVAELRKIHSLPHRRQGTLLGLVNIRGELLLCLSLARVLHLPQSPAPRGERLVLGRLLVANWEGHRLAFPVDEVHGVHRFDPEQLREPPVTLTRSGTSYTNGILAWEGRLVSCLDADLLFPSLSQNLA